jgi:hypothetical protein
MNKPGRNDPCPCGSGKKSKRCCGNVSPASSKVANYSRSGLLHDTDFFHDEVIRHIELGNLARAEIICRCLLDRCQGDAQALNALGLIAQKIQMHSFTVDYFNKAVAAAPEWAVPRDNLAAIEKELAGKVPAAASVGSLQRFLVIKAWGFGFWSDVDHVLGGLLLAEITGRIPVIHWGSNSLFSDNPAHDAFTAYFASVSDVTLGELIGMNNDYFPPKWSATNLRDEDVAKWEGSYSRRGAVYFIGRKEAVAVSDFHISVLSLVPWIEQGHPLHGLSTDDLYRYLFSKYLKPVKAAQDQIDHFYNEHLAGRRPYVAVHVRGSDKCLEVPNLDEINLQYFNQLDKFGPDWHIFLLTDSQIIADLFTRKYGNRLVLTDSLRSEDDIGIHYKSHNSKSRLGYEVMKDTYLAARADHFIGNGASNVSCMVGYIKNWNKGKYTLLVQNSHHQRRFDVAFHG